MSEDELVRNGCPDVIKEEIEEPWVTVKNEDTATHSSDNMFRSDYPGNVIVKEEIDIPFHLKEHGSNGSCDSEIKNELETTTDSSKLVEIVLRKKWKYLWDQFSVECGKTRVPKSGDAAESTIEPKWPYFKHKLFLKDVVKPRSSSSNLKTKIQTAPDDRFEDSDGNLGTPEGEEKYEIDSNLVETVAEHSDCQTLEVEQSTNLHSSQPSKRKRVTTNNALYNEKMLHLEQQKINAIQSVLQRQPDNDDIMFFKSLLPFVSKIPTEKKLIFRNRILKVVHQFAHGVERNDSAPSSSK